MNRRFSVRLLSAMVLSMGLVSSNQFPFASSKSVIVGGRANKKFTQEAIALSNPTITTFEIKTLLGAGAKADSVGNNPVTTNPRLDVRAQFAHADRVGFYRLGEIACPESVSDHVENRMKNLPWQPYSQGMSLTYRLDTSLPQPYGTRCVFMQVNTTQNESSASPAKGDSIVFAPAHLKTFTIAGPTLKTFIDRAKALGYRFTFSDPSFDANYPCPTGTSPNVPLVPGTDFFVTYTEKIFDRNDGFLNPFWTLSAIKYYSPGNPFEVTMSGPPSGRSDDPFRTVGFKSGFRLATKQGFTCPIGTSGLPHPSDITLLTFEGPDDKQPEDALFDPTFHSFQLNPRLIRPLNFRP